MDKVQKQKLIVSYKNCSEEVLNAINEKYPNGYGSYVFKVTKPNGDFFYAITVETDTKSYLVKVDVKIDDMTEEDFEKEYGSTSALPPDDDNFGGNDDTNLDNIEATNDDFDE